MTKQQLHDFAHFVREYCDLNITEEVMEGRHGLDTDELNFSQAVDAYVDHHKIKLETE